MKNSNKILLGIISVILLTMLSLFVFAKSSLITYQGDELKGNGNIIRKSYDMENIGKVLARRNQQFFIKQGPPSLEIETDENILAFIRPDSDIDITYMKDETEPITTQRLRLGQMDIDIYPTQGIKVYLSTPNLSEILCTGNSSVVFENSMDFKKLRVDIEGTSKLDLKANVEDLNLIVQGDAKAKVTGEIGNTQTWVSGVAQLDLSNLNAENLFIQASGDASAKLAGQVKETTMNVAGVASVDAVNVHCNNATLTGKGDSNISIFVDSTLNAKLLTAATIKYKGNPTVTHNLKEDSDASLVKIEK